MILFLSTDIRLCENFNPRTKASKPIMSLFVSRRENFTDMDHSTSIGFNLICRFQRFPCMNRHCSRRNRGNFGVRLNRCKYSRESRFFGLESVRSERPIQTIVGAFPPAKTAVAKYPYIVVFAGAFRVGL
jgi:hypothetical protein